MEFGDELPCGGYQNEDQKIEAEMKQIVEGKEGKEEKGCGKKEECGDCECKPVPKVE